MPKLYQFASALTVDTGIYADGDSLCTLLTVTGVVRRAGYLSRLVGVTLIDKDDEGAALDLYFFDRSVTLPANNSAWNVSDADMLFCQGRTQIVTGDYTDCGGNRVAVPDMSGREIVVKPNSGTSLYMGAICRGTPTYTTASDLYIVLSFLQD
jgi:hypothetical protein